jgi:hypothetical protein
MTVTLEDRDRCRDTNRRHRHRAHWDRILVEISAGARRNSKEGLHCERNGFCWICLCRAEAERQNSKVLCGFAIWLKSCGTSFGGIFYITW